MLVGKRQVNDAFATWLRREMQRRGYETEGTRAGGRSRLAEEADVSPSAISRVLNEGRTPDDETLRRIGRVLGYSLGEMLVFAGRAATEELFVRKSEPLTGEAAIWAVRGYSDEEKREAIAFLRTRQALNEERAEREKHRRAEGE